LSLNQGRVKKWPSENQLEVVCARWGAIPLPHLLLQLSEPGIHYPISEQRKPLKNLARAALNPELAAL